MQRFLTPLLVMMLYLVSTNTSAQQFESFRQINTGSSAAGAVTSITLAPTPNTNPSSLSFLNAAGLSTVFDLNFTSSPIIRDGTQIFLPSASFPDTAPGIDLENVQFFTGTLSDPENPETNLPAHWFRLTLYNGIWSGVFRVADRIYSIDRSNRDNIVEVRNTPSLNNTLQPTRQIKITAIIDEAFVFADSPGDSVGLDDLGHIYALESLHIMEGVTNDSLGISLTLDQLVYRLASEITSPEAWLADNAISFGIDDNFASFVFRGDESLTSQVGTTPGNSFALQTTFNFNQLTSAHLFGQLLGIIEEDNTLQSSQNPLNNAHWSESQRNALLNNLPNPSLIQTISLDEPEIEITETEDIANPIPQNILDSESVESTDQSNIADSNDDGLLQNDETASNNNSDQSSDSGGGTYEATSLLNLLLIALFGRRRFQSVRGN